MAGNSEENNGIKVYARIRKLMAWEAKQMSLKWDVKSITNIGYTKQREERTISTYKFTQVYPPSVENPMVFDNLVKPLIKRVCGGYNAVLMAYGQTGAGKTHSLLGKPKRKILGLLPMALEYFLDDPQVVKITVKAMEAFGQMQTKIRIYDLLDPANDVDHWHQKEGKSTFNFRNVTSREVTNFDEACECVRFAQANSHYAPTGKNPESSRGHIVFVVDVVSKAPNDDMPAGLDTSTRRAALLFCDLAGSEGESALGPEFMEQVGAANYKARRMEAGVINTGLSDLQMLFKEMKKEGKLRDFQGAGLRRILKQYIQDNSTYISVLFCVSPAPNNAVSTESTLKFAEQACQIKVVPKQVRKHTNWKDLSHKLRDLNKKQQNDIQHLKEHSEKLLNDLKDLQVLRDKFQQVYKLDIPGLHTALEKADLLDWFDDFVVADMARQEEDRAKSQQPSTTQPVAGTAGTVSFLAQRQQPTYNINMCCAEAPGKSSTTLHSEDFSRDFEAEDHSISLDQKLKWRNHRGDSVASACSIDMDKISTEHRTIYEQASHTQSKYNSLLAEVDMADEESVGSSDDSLNYVSTENVCWDYDETAFRQYVNMEKDKYLAEKRKESRKKNFSSGDIDLDFLEKQEEISTLRAKVDTLETTLANTKRSMNSSKASQDFWPEPNSKEDGLNIFLKSCGNEYEQYFDALMIADFYVDRLASTYPSELEKIVPDENHRGIILERAQNNKTPQAVAMEYVKYYNAHDLRKLCNLYASHCRNIQYALNTPINGKQAISEAYETMFKQYPEMGCKVLRMHEPSFNSIVLEWEGWWEKDHEPKLHGCTVFVVEHGVITEQREYWDKLHWKRHHGVDYESRPTWSFVFGLGAFSVGAGYLLRHRRLFLPFTQIK